MFRTRDFVLLFSAIMFLLMAIGTTLINQNRGISYDALVNGEQLAAVADEDLQAFVSDGDVLDRAAQVARMRALIAQQTNLNQSLPEVEEQEVDEEEIATSSDEGAVVGTLVQCANYQPYAGFWDARGLSSNVREGALVLTRGDISSTSIPELVLQLPLRQSASNNPSCLPTDVVGIANDGSLIRNDEASLYSIFGSDTQIGYTLDGFPLYGIGAGEIDACGGRKVAGQYRYELSSQRDVILNCFAATPVNIP